MGTFSESGAEAFKVGYFDKTAYLAQSPQFYKQMAMAAGFDRVFEIGPAFRAEPSFTSRHETEFTSIDMEVAWTASHHDLMALEEALAGRGSSPRRLPQRIVRRWIACSACGSTCPARPFPG